MGTVFEERHRVAAALMLDELQGSQLEVMKVQGEPNDVRTAVQRNAPWYRRFCEAHKKPRNNYPRPRTIIKRCATVGALQRIIQSRLRNGAYEQRLANFVIDYADEHSQLIDNILQANEHQPEPNEEPWT